MERMVLIPSDISQLGKDYLRDKGYTIKRGRGTDKKPSWRISQAVMLCWRGMSISPTA